MPSSPISAARRRGLLPPVLVVLVVSAVWLAGAAACPARADVALGRMFGDHMVLQCERPCRIWGTAAAHEAVEVSIAGVRGRTTADERGNWLVELPAQPPGGPHELVVRGGNERRLADVLFGEVWLGAGQSNMVWILANSQDGGATNDAADLPLIRTFTVGEKRSATPCDDLVEQAFNGPAEWRVCGRGRMGYFSAVGLFFARELHRALDRPVGIMIAAVNGTRIEHWSSAGAEPVGAELSSVPPAEYGELYHGMVHPLMPLARRGVIWYQGEGNVGDGMRYAARMRALISGWRAAGAGPEMPFYFVQLTPLNWGGKPVDELPKVWEAQTAALDVPGTGMAVTNDIGNVGDAHPRNKRDVGLRLARLALKHTYGRDVPCDPPLHAGLRLEGTRARIRFRGTAGGLRTRDGGPPTWFAVAGADRAFVPAQARIEGEEVVVWSERVPQPVAVRFAWHQTAVHNLVNGAGLPASPFRTDDW